MRESAKSRRRLERRSPLPPLPPPTEISFRGFRRSLRSARIIGRIDRSIDCDIITSRLTSSDSRRFFYLEGRSIVFLFLIVKISFQETTLCTFFAYNSLLSQNYGINIETLVITRVSRPSEKMNYFVRRENNSITDAPVYVTFAPIDPEFLRLLPLNSYGSGDDQE